MSGKPRSRGHVPENTETAEIESAQLAAVASEGAESTELDELDELDEADEADPVDDATESDAPDEPAEPEPSEESAHREVPDTGNSEAPATKRDVHPVDAQPTTSTESPVPPPRRISRRGILAIIVGALLLISVAIGAGPVIRRATDHPTAFTSQAFGYTITLPGASTVTPNSGADGDSAERVSWSAGDQAAAVVADRLSVAVVGSRLQAVLQDALDSSAKSLDARHIEPARSFTLDGAPALSETFTTARYGTIYEVVCIRADVVYVIDLGGLSAAATRRVVDSFAFTP